MKKHFSQVLDLTYSKIAPYLNSAHLKIPKNSKKKCPKILEKLVYDERKMIRVRVFYKGDGASLSQCHKSFLAVNWTIPSSHLNLCG